MLILSAVSKMAIVPSGRLKALGSAILLVCLACSSSVNPANAPRSISLTGPDGGKGLSAGVGVEIGLAVTVKNAAGETIAPGGPLRFASRDSTVVSVNQTGVISTVGLGTTYVVVALSTADGTLQDSVGVLVGKPIADAGTR